MTVIEHNVVRQFLTALPAAARDHLRHSSGYSQQRLITAACTHHNPAQLAKTVSAGITRTHPANAPGLLLYRLKRAAGWLDDEQEDTG